MSMSGELNYTVLVHDEGPEGFWAEVEELPGCFATGDTLDELWDSVGESISLYLSTPESPVEARMVRPTANPERREVIEAHRVMVDA